jgi:HK97 family phage major capsid protein
MRTLAELQKLRAELSDRFQKVTASVENETPTAEQEAEIVSIRSEIEQVAGEIAAAEAKREAYKSSLAATQSAFRASDIQPHKAGLPTNSPYTPEAIAKTFATQIERRAKGSMSGPAKFIYKGDTELAALGAQFIGALHGDRSCIDAVRPESEHWDSRPSAVMNTSDNNKGGYLVPTDLIPQLIALREQYGVVRRNASVVTVGAPSGNYPRLVSGQEAEFVPEPMTADGTDSGLEFDNIAYNLRRMSSFVPASEDIITDSIIDISAEVFRDAQIHFAKREDRACLLGNGEANNGNIQGIIPLLLLAANSDSKIIAGSGEITFATVKIETLTRAVGSIPEFADDGDAKWFISRFGMATALDRLKLTAGGNTTQILEGRTIRQWSGYPIEVSQLMERAATSTNNDPFALFGNMRMSSKLFTDNAMSMRLFTEHAPRRHQILYRTSQRMDFNFHERVSEDGAGPLVLLVFANS